MKRYFLSVILVALVGGICEELLPEDGALRPHLRLVTAICVLALLVLPGREMLAGIGSFLERVDLDGILSSESESLRDYEEILEDALSRFSREEAERSLQGLLEERFDLQRGSCRVEITLGEDGSPERVLVTLSGFSMLKDPREIAQVVLDRLGCPCDVTVE